MPSLIVTDVSTIAAAVETALLAASNVGDISNIYWVEEGSTPPPGITGQRDIILYQVDDDFEGSESSTVVGSGRGAAIKAGLRIAVRNTLALDRTATRKDWFIANDKLVTSLLDTLMEFFPVDANQNALTIEGFVPTNVTAPSKDRDAMTWGQEIAAFKFHYLPGVGSVIP